MPDQSMNLFIKYKNYTYEYGSLNAKINNISLYKDKINKDKIKILYEIIVFSEQEIFFLSLETEIFDKMTNKELIYSNKKDISEYFKEEEPSYIYPPSVKVDKNLINYFGQFIEKDNIFNVLEPYFMSENTKKLFITNGIISYLKFKIGEKK